MLEAACKEINSDSDKTLDIEDVEMADDAQIPGEIQNEPWMDDVLNVHPDPKELHDWEERHAKWEENGVIDTTQKNYLNHIYQVKQNIIDHKRKNGYITKEMRAEDKRNDLVDGFSKNHILCTLSQIEEIKFKGSDGVEMDLVKEYDDKLNREYEAAVKKRKEFEERKRKAREEADALRRARLDAELEQFQAGKGEVLQRQSALETLRCATNMIPMPVKQGDRIKKQFAVDGVMQNMNSNGSVSINYKLKK